MDPLVSVLTPSFNQAAWLKDNLLSVSNQTYSNIEHIVMDGGSTDGTVEILQNASPRVIWCSEPDEGQSDALNKAFEISSGEIIGWINSDDAYVDRRVVERVVKIFESESEIDVVYGDVLLVDEANHILEYFPLSWTSFVDRLVTRRKSVLKFGAPYMQPGVFIRRSALDGQFVRRDLHFCMDTALWMRLADRGKKPRYAGFVVGIDRQQPARKGLVPKYLEIQRREMNALAREYDMERGLVTALRHKFLRASQRCIGAVRVLQIRQNVDPAFGLLVDGPFYRLKRQLFTRRSLMHSAKGRMVPLRRKRMS